MRTNEIVGVFDGKVLIGYIQKIFENDFHACRPNGENKPDGHWVGCFSLLSDAEHWLVAAHKGMLDQITIPRKAIFEHGRIDGKVGRLKLYIIEHPTPNHNQFDGAVVAASSEAEARTIHPYPNEDGSPQIYPNWKRKMAWSHEWPETPLPVVVKLIGRALDNVTTPTVIDYFYQYG